VEAYDSVAKSKPEVISTMPCARERDEGMADIARGHEPEAT